MCVRGVAFVNMRLDGACDGEELISSSDDAGERRAIAHDIPGRATADGGGRLLGGRYQVHAPIGSGAMADVYRARDTVLERDVAIKVFRPEYVAHDAASPWATPVAGPARERQQLEVAALARLNHPNLITLYDGCIDPTPADGRSAGHEPAYLVMELVDGPSLAARIAAGPLPEPAVREIAVQLADALAYVHARGMVHRDVKPANVLLGHDRCDDDSTVRARLADFGIVRLLGTERLTGADFTLGTASYLAPEQARGSHVEPPADIYSLGLVLLEALTGRRAFTGPPVEAALARLSQRPGIPDGLPEPWPRLLHAMTETDPARRPSATAVARALRTPQLLRTQPARAFPLLEAPPRRVRRVNGTMITAALSVLAIAGTLGVFFLTGKDAQSAAGTPTVAPAAQQSRSAPPSKPIARVISHAEANAVTAPPVIGARRGGRAAASPTPATARTKRSAAGTAARTAAPRGGTTTSASAQPAGPTAAASSTPPSATTASAPSSAPPSSPAQSAAGSTSPAPGGSASANAPGPSSAGSSTPAAASTTG